MRLVLQLLGLLVPQQTAPVVPLPILMHWPPQQVSFAVLLQHVPPHSAAHMGGSAVAQAVAAWQAQHRRQQYGLH